LKLVLKKQTFSEQNLFKSNKSLGQDFIKSTGTIGYFSPVEKLARTLGSVQHFVFCYEITRCYFMWMFKQFAHDFL